MGVERRTLVPACRTGPVAPADVRAHLRFAAAPRGAGGRPGESPGPLSERRLDVGRCGLVAARRRGGGPAGAGWGDAGRRRAARAAAVLRRI